MKTKKVRAVLVESENNKDRQYPCILKYSHMFGDVKGKIGYFDCNIRTTAIKMEIILISLEDEIKTGDLVYEKYPDFKSIPLSICKDPKAYDEDAAAAYAADADGKQTYSKKLLEEIIEFVNNN